MKKLLILLILSTIALSGCGRGGDLRWSKSNPMYPNNPNGVGMPYAPGRVNLIVGADDEGPHGDTTVERRQMQTRYYDTTDKKAVMDSVVSTMLDWGSYVSYINFDFGLIYGGYMVTVTPTSDQRMRVRVRISNGIPRNYISFFDQLSKAMFLDEHLE